MMKELDLPAGECQCIGNEQWFKFSFMFKVFIFLSVFHAPATPSFLTKWLQSSGLSPCILGDSSSTRLVIHTMAFCILTISSLLLGMVCLALTRTKWAVLIFSWTAGVMYSTLFTMPYLLVRNINNGIK